tara:strand:- start:625 stop:2397 length:1773 start_codon:yes stop_codon:yes gene_type:complete
MAYTIGVKYFNSFWLKSISALQAPAYNKFRPSWMGLPWQPVGYPSYPASQFPASNPPYIFTASYNSNYYLEESRIKGGFNNSQVSLGVRAYVVNQNINSLNRKSSLIYSGLINTRTGFNETNVFSIADPLIRDLDPLNGSIQKLYTEDTNLNVFQEAKVSKILINKNAIYSGDQGSVETGNIRVLGQDVPYLGEYGISRNPESFAVYGYRKYFADKDRAAILRLSRDGITEISGYGMKDYFRDTLATLSDEYIRNQVQKDLVTNPPSIGILTSFDVLGSSEDVELGSTIELLETSGNSFSTGVFVSNVVQVNTNKFTVTASAPINFNVSGTYKNVVFVTFRKGKVLGAWDSHQSAYTLSMQTKPRTISKEANTFATLGYDEQIKGWTSFYSFKPVLMGSLKNNFYTFIDSNIYQHYDESVPNSRCKFYGATEPAKAFVEFIFNPNPTVMKNFNTIAYEGNNGWEVTSYKSDFEGFDQVQNAGTFQQYQDSTNFIRSYVEGQYDSANPPNYGTAATVQPIFRAGFDRKENHYVANLINNSTARPGEVIFGNQVSGVKGYLMTVKMSIDNDTDTGGAKQLFSVSSNYVLSSR